MEPLLSNSSEVSIPQLFAYTPGRESVVHTGSAHLWQTNLLGVTAGGRSKPSRDAGHQLGVDGKLCQQSQGELGVGGGNPFLT